MTKFLAFAWIVCVFGGFMAAAVLLNNQVN